MHQSYMQSVSQLVAALMLVLGTNHSTIIGQDSVTICHFLSHSVK